MLEFLAPKFRKVEVRVEKEPPAVPVLPVLTDLTITEALIDCRKLPESILTDKYKVHHVLGKGTFGTVNLARHRLTRRTVAIKSLRGCEKYDPNDLREVLFFQKVTPHANLVMLEDMFVDAQSRQVHFVLELMQFNLLELIRARHGHVVDCAVVHRLGGDILRGIAHVHSHGFVHRDIKPENILIGYSSTSSFHENGQMVAKIADFGLCREFDEHDPDSGWTGYVATRWYRAPEQLMQLKGHGYPLDIWAFGVVIAELCNLRPLFPGKDALDMLRIQLRVLGSPDASWPGTQYLKAGISPVKQIITPKSLCLFNDIVLACLKWDACERAEPHQLLAQFKEQPKLFSLRTHHRGFSIS